MGSPNEMTKRILEGAKAAVAAALEEHRKAGRSVVIGRDGHIVVLRPEQIRVQQIDRAEPIAEEDNELGM